MADQPNIVLVHGAWPDGASWRAAIERLQAASNHVAMVSHPEEVVTMIETAAAAVPVPT